ncbi:MAG: mechanosensitive ion channel family protein [Pseudomonadota bacterium]
MALFRNLLIALIILSPIASQAQETQPTEEAAPASANDAEAAPAEEEAPEIDPNLTDQAVDSDTLELLILPLTVDELTALADEWVGISKGLTKEVVDLRVELLQLEPDDPAGEPLREELSEVLERRNAAFGNLGVVTEHLFTKGGDEAAINTYRAYRASIVATETQNTDWRTLVKLSMDWAQDRDGGIQLLIDLAIVVGSIIGLVIIARIVRLLSRRSFRRIPNISKLLVAFLAGCIYWITLSFGLLIVLSILGINITPLFALVGGATFILAFAMQDTLANLASGVMIIINRPFDEGDYVDLAGTSGTVDSVSIVSTKVTTPDNQVIIIPNSKVWGDIITNVTASDTRRVDLIFGIGYDDSIEDAQRVLEEVVEAHSLVLETPAPVIRVGALGASSVDFIVRPWTKTADYWTVYWDLTRQVKERFDAEGISIPYPQTDMHIRMPEGSVAALPVPATATSQGDGVGRPEGAPDYRSGDTATD